MTAFDPEFEHTLNIILLAKSKSNDIRQMLVTNDLLDYKSLKQVDTKHVYTMTYDVIGAPTKLKDHNAIRVVKIIEYIRFHESNSDNDLAEDLSK